MAEPVYGIDDFPDDDSLWRCRMDRWRWLQHERAERPPNHRLPNAASSGRDESAQRASSFLANENNGKDQCWSATVHLNRFGLAAAAAGSNESRCLPPST